MRAGKGGEDQIPDIGMARMNGQLVARFGAARGFVDVGEIQGGIDALRVEIERQRHDIDVARALAIAEQGTLDPLGAGHDGELRCRHGGTPVVVRMHTQNHAIALVDMPREPFDLVGVHVRRRHLDGGGQIEDGFALPARLPNRIDRIADFNREIEFGAGEALRTVLEYPLRAPIAFGVLAHLRGTAHGDIDDAGAIESKNHAPLRDGSGVVDMNDRAPRAHERLVGARDEFRPRLRQHLNGDVIRDEPLLDDLANEVEIRLRGGGKSDLDLLEADLHQHVEHAALARRVHGLDQRLVAVPQIDAAPRGRRSDDRVGPGTIVEPDWGKGTVFGRRVTQHNILSPTLDHLRLVFRGILFGRMRADR